MTIQCKKIQKNRVKGGGVFLEWPRGFIGGLAKWPCLTTMGEGGGQNFRKSDHVVYGCPLGYFVKICSKIFKNHVYLCSKKTYLQQKYFKIKFFGCIWLGPISDFSKEEMAMTLTTKWLNHWIKKKCVWKPNELIHQNQNATPDLGIVLASLVFWPGQF